MFDIIGKYRASMFLNASDIIPTPEIISSLLDIFKDKGLLPTTFQEIGSDSPAMQLRLRLNSPSNEWAINFASRRIDIEKNPVEAAGKNMGDVDVFINDVIDLMARILKHFHKKGNRLSIVTSGLLREMRGKHLDSIYKKLFYPLPFYKEPLPFEWNHRSATRKDIKIEGIDEKINVITSINRVRGKFMKPDRLLPFDRIEIAFDINTLAEEGANRFSIHSMKEFLEHTLVIRNSIVKEIEGVIK